MWKGFLLELARGNCYTFFVSSASEPWSMIFECGPHLHCVGFGVHYIKWMLWSKCLVHFFLYQYIFETTVWKGFSSWVDKRELLHLRSFFMGFHIVKRMLEGYTTYQVMIVFLSPFLCQDKIKNQCQAILTEFDILHNWLKGKKLF